MKYFLQREGRSFGPYSFDDLKRYQSEGRIGPEDKIRPEDSENWVLQTEFFNPPAAPAPQVSPAPVFMPPAPAPAPAPAPTPTPAPNPFAAPTDANPVWTPPAPAPQANPFAPSGATSSNPFSAPPTGGFGAPPAQQGFGAPPASPGFGAPPAQQGFGAPPANSGFGGPPASPGFGAPAPGGFAPAPNPAASGAWPAPPDMQWYLVLIITMVCGFFGLYWFYTQMAFVKKLDPASKAMKMIFGGWGLAIGGVLIGAILGAALSDSALALIPILLTMVCYLGGIIAIILGVFNMRASIEKHYNTVENIGLKLSPVMTFFFNMYYFQYHFARIAEWKKTGRLA
jgi:hypothetical protein